MSVVSVIQVFSMLDGFRHPAITILPDYISQVIDYHPSLSVLALAVSLTRPRRIVELGVYRGDSLMMMAQASQEIGTNPEIFGIDWFQGDSAMGTYNGDEVLAQIQSYLKQVPQYNVRLLKMTCNEAAPLFKDNSIDLLHIDAGHEYTEVKHDFETWLPKMNTQTGIMLFHDTHYSYSHSPKIQVWKFWAEVKQQYQHFEFPHACGVGLLVIGTAPTLDIQDLIFSPTYRREAIQRFLAAQGQRVVDWAATIKTLEAVQGGSMAWMPRPGISSSEQGSLVGSPGTPGPVRSLAGTSSEALRSAGFEQILIREALTATSDSTTRTDGTESASKEVTSPTPRPSSSTLTP